jgi:ActR/RegA family two-component response regulator
MITHQRILLIRSDDDTHRELRVRLESRGYDVFEAEDDREGMRMAWELEPDLVLGEEPVLAGDRGRTLDDVVLAIGTLLD